MYGYQASMRALLLGVLRDALPLASESPLRVFRGRYPTLARIHRQKGN
jgi:hypothetical protein